MERWEKANHHHHFPKKMNMPVYDHPARERYDVGRVPEKSTAAGGGNSRRPCRRLSRTLALQNRVLSSEKIPEEVADRQQRDVEPVGRRGRARKQDREKKNDVMLPSFV